MKTIIPIILTLLSFSRCHKSFLEEPTAKSLVIPRTYQDFNALIQYSNDMNTGAFFYMISDGDFTLSDTYLNTATALNRNTYLWKEDIFETLTFSPGWRIPYLQILNANVVLEGIQVLTTADATQEEINNLKGNALFFRAMAYTELILNFTAPYVPSEAHTLQGLPLRRTSNVSDLQQRASLKETMDFVINDLKESIILLPENSKVISLPNKAAAYTLLSRTYLGMQDYEASLKFAKEALKLKGDLIDYKNIPIRTPYTFNNPFTNTNSEILFYQRGNQSTITRNKAFQLVKNFYDSFQTNDLRKNRLFDGNRNFIGSYSGTDIIFSGITNNEAWLTAAECAVRVDKFEDAINYLNTLCVKRYDHTYVPYKSFNKMEILKWILEERRKELVTRSRWFDLRRLNLDPELALTLTRTYMGENFTLSPNSSRYTFPIPQEEIDFSDITQNIRSDSK